MMSVADEIATIVMLKGDSRDLEGQGDFLGHHEPTCHDQCVHCDPEQKDQKRQTLEAKSAMRKELEIV
jgi:pyrimidine operon attenuation protein/uracil phosphoribosyltransferase